MKNTFSLLAIGTIIATTISVSFISRDALWSLIGGAADQGPVEFAKLRRPARPNHFLACPANLCVGTTPDVAAPTFSVRRETLRDRAVEAWAEQANLERVDRTNDGFQVRYIERTPIMRFPDTVNVRFIAVGEASSTIAFYSSSLIGYSDFGANKARYERWLELVPIEADVKP